MSECKELKKLGASVKALRIERKLTQADCFNDTGIHFGRIEQGKRDISYTTLLRIADYFGVDLDEFRKEIEELSRQ